MPAILPPSEYDAWLDPGRRDPQSVEGLLLLPSTMEDFVAEPVSTISQQSPERRARVHCADYFRLEDPTMNHTDESEGFDVEGAVKDYRSIIEHLEAATSPEAKDKYRGRGTSARQKWKQWQGEDSLDETTFGEPE